MDIDLHRVLAFVDGDAGGNPAGVVLDADRLDHDARQRVAQLAAYSETAFVGRSASCTVKLAFFTPTRAIPHCGHATVGTLAVMAARGLLRPGIHTNETVDGPRRLLIDGERAFLEQPMPDVQPLDGPEALLAALGITAADLREGPAPALARNGTGTVLVPVRDAAVLGRLAPDMAAIQALTDRLDAVCLYVFALGGNRPGRDATARMFAPGYGIPEESATGMAGGACAGWLASVAGLPGDRLALEQGHFMSPPAPSLLEARIDRHAGRVWIGGRARIAESRRLSLRANPS